MTDLVNVCNNFFDSSPRDIAKIKIDFDRVVRPQTLSKESEQAVDDEL
jgi:hypothetical protein